MIITGYLYHQASFWTPDQKKNIVKCLTVLSVFYGGLFIVNRMLVPHVQQSHSWQYAKIYDLAAMSVDTQHDLLPDFLKKENYSMSKLEALFTHVSVDNLVWGETAILAKCQDTHQQEILWWLWARSVILHPFVYLKHRFQNLRNVLLPTPGHMQLKAFTSSHNISGLPAKGLSLIAFVFSAHFSAALLSLVYLVLGIVRFRTCVYAKPLVLLNSVSILMLMVLLFFSMAGTPRYSYIVLCMTHLSHAFAWKCFMSLLQKKKKMAHAG